MSVTLINLFSVPDGLESQFVESWHKTAEQMKQQPGFIDTTLHRQLKSGETYQFVNIAHWETPEDFRNAQSAVTIFEKELDIRANPALYSIKAQY